MTFKASIKKILVKYKLYSLYNMLYQVYLWYQKIKVEVLYRNKAIYKLSIGNETIQYDTSDNYSKRWFYLNISSDSIYEPALSYFLNDSLKPGNCFLDIGAHIGYFSCIAANKLEKGEVHLFEVDKNCIGYINKNISINGFKNIIVNNLAISDSTDGVFIPDKNAPNNKTSILSHKSIGRAVSSETIDRYIEKQQLKPDFIKIDVEAAEVKVLRGMQKTLRLKPLTLLIEVHANVLPFFGFSTNEVLKILFDNGFTLFELTDFRNKKYEKRQIKINDSITENTLIVAVKRG